MAKKKRFQEHGLEEGPSRKEYEQDLYKLQVELACLKNVVDEISLAGGVFYRE